MASAVSTEQNKEIVSRFAEEVVNNGNYEHLEELVADDIVDHTPLGEDRGREAVLETTKYLRAAFPDFSVSPQEIIAEGDTVAVRMTQQGTHEGEFMGNEPTGNSFEIDAMAFLRVEDGKIVERRVQPDVLGLLQQLGVVESPGE